MPQETGLVQLDQNTTRRRFMITLTTTGDDDTAVRSCEVVGPTFRNRTSFGTHSNINDVFVPHLAKSLDDCMARLNGETEVISLSDYHIEIRGLTLAGATVIATKVGEGALHVIIRFQMFIGGVNNAFLQGVGFIEDLDTEADRLSTMVLSELAMPIVNLCEAIRTGVTNGEDNWAKLDKLGRKLSETSHEISFQIELLKRFVQRRHTSDHATATTPGAVRIGADEMVPQHAEAPNLPPTLAHSANAHASGLRLVQSQKA